MVCVGGRGCAREVDAVGAEGGRERVKANKERHVGVLRCVACSLSSLRRPFVDTLLPSAPSQPITRAALNHRTVQTHHSLCVTSLSAFASSISFSFLGWTKRLWERICKGVAEWECFLKPHARSGQPPDCAHGVRPPCCHGSGLGGDVERLSPDTFPSFPSKRSQAKYPVG